mmetsp:Transcript_64049/g.202642  ORF Transcript_64049/g.202642 Transcript_64049/m.202642 type:complete len:92 (-) Transcript_64049:362-637(-)
MGIVATARTEELHAIVTRGAGSGSADCVGKWYMNQSPSTLEKLKTIYTVDTHPTDARLEDIAKELGAPSKGAVRTYFQTMELRATEIHTTI